MALASHIVKRPGSANYYARLRVPEDIHVEIGKRELWQTLRTTDAKQAKARGAAVLHRWQTEFDEARRRRNATPRDLTSAAWSHYTTGLERDARERADLPGQAALDRERQRAIEAMTALPDGQRAGLNGFAAALDYLAVMKAPQVRKRRDELRAKALREHLATGETALIAHAADAFILAAGLNMTRLSPDYPALCQTLIRAELEVLERGRERDAGNWTGTPRDPAVRPPTPDSTPRMAAPGETIMELFARFRTEKHAAVTLDTWEQNEKALTSFTDFLGAGAHVTAITRKSIRDWKQALQTFPVRAVDTKEFAGLSFKEVIAANAKVGKPTLSDKTVNRYLASLGRFCKWLEDSDYIEDGNLTSGQFLKIDKRKQKVFPFTSNQLGQIFASPLFHECGGTGKEHRPGSWKLRDHRYWLPWIAVFSGMRLAEIAQLEVADLRQIHGEWCFHVTTLGDADKSVKTEGSQRIVPVHARLIELGIIEYRAGLEKRGEKRLFPYALRDSRGQFGDASRFANRYLEKIGIKDGRGLNFHSFRHTVADALRNAGHLDEAFAPLLGHSRGTMTSRYGVIPQGTLAARKAMIDSITYPGL